KGDGLTRAVGIHDVEIVSCIDTGVGNARHNRNGRAMRHQSRSSSNTLARASHAILAALALLDPHALGIDIWPLATTAQRNSPLSLTNRRYRRLARAACRGASPQPRPVPAFLCTRLKTTGTNIKVATVENVRPPITARPSGAFCSPPS